MLHVCDVIEVIHGVEGLLQISFCIFPAAAVCNPHEAETIYRFCLFCNHYKGKWDSAALEVSLRQSVIEKVYQHARETKQSVLCIIDDTIASKTRPSSQAVHPMEATSNHMSHLKGQMDYGHQAIGVMLVC